MYLWMYSACSLSLTSLVLQKRNDPRAVVVSAVLEFGEEKRKKQKAFCLVDWIAPVDIFLIKKTDEIEIFQSDFLFFCLSAFLLHWILIFSSVSKLLVSLFIWEWGKTARGQLSLWILWNENYVYLECIFKKKHAYICWYMKTISKLDQQASW